MARNPNRRREEDAPAVLTRRSSVWLIWFILFVWFVSFIWLNQTNRINQRDQMNQRNQTDQRDGATTRQTKIPLHETRFTSHNLRTLADLFSSLLGDGGRER